MYGCGHLVYVKTVVISRYESEASIIRFTRCDVEKLSYRVPYLEMAQNHLF